MALRLTCTVIVFIIENNIFYGGELDSTGIVEAKVAYRGSICS